MVVNVFSWWENTWMLVGNFVDGSLSSKSWYCICSHRRWSDLMCPSDVFMIPSSNVGESNVAVHIETRQDSR